LESVNQGSRRTGQPPDHPPGLQECGGSEKIPAAEKTVIQVRKEDEKTTRNFLRVVFLTSYSIPLGIKQAQPKAEVLAKMRSSGTPQIA